MRPRRLGRAYLATGLLALVAAGALLTGGDDEPAAPAATLDLIAAKNHDAAMVAAARAKAQSEASAAAADARMESEEANVAARP
ncbi:MAG TPA: hypothetical protein VN231_04405 [Allosphingosinicella sp.]|nr:hypothetical protein [Allosphingosinicella sp.]